MHGMELTFGTWTFFGGATFIDLIAASTNALNGALLARRPDHYKNFTFVGIILMAIIGGIAGGVTRDIILEVPVSAFMNPAYITLCVLFGVIGYFIAYASGQLFREGLFQFMTSFSLPWYAIVGAQKATENGFPIIGAVAIAVIAPTAGRFMIDIACGVPPKQFVRGEWFVVTAAATGLLWILLDATGMPSWASVAISFLAGFGFRVLALYLGWEEPLAKEPKGIHMHADRRPLLGRKLEHKSKEELRYLGLDPELAPNGAPHA